MLDQFLFVGLAYASLLLCVVGFTYRIIWNPYSQTARTSQFLESRTLVWGIVPFHIGIIVVFIGHLLAIVAPGLWQAAMNHRGILLGVEAIGIGASVLCIWGLLVLTYRRLVSDRLQVVTTTMDMVVLALLLVQIIGGVTIALGHRWGAAWAPQTLVPYLWSLAGLRPNVAYVAEMAPIIKIHIALAWVLIMLIPFSRLSHFFALPLSYATRPPQKVVWANARYKPDPESSAVEMQNQRRLFLRGAGGTGVATGLLALGTADQFYQFFKGPDMTPHENEELLKKKVSRLQMTLNQRKLELERADAEFVYVAEYKDLLEDTGKYFIDFKMRPAMAFVQDSGIPLVLSAKCTHLGCTVGNKLNEKGHVLCPCHISYFDIKTGAPNTGPAKDPLPHLGWVLKNKQDEVVASAPPSGDAIGITDPTMLQDCGLFIVRPASEDA